MRLLCVLLPFLANLNLAQSQAENMFLSTPPLGPANNFVGNPAYPYLSVQTVEWISNYSGWSLYLYHVDGSKDFSQTLLTSGYNLEAGQRRTTYRWNISQDTDYTKYPVYYLGVGGVPTGGFLSHYFNITAPISSTSSSSSLASSTASSTKTDATAAATTTGTTPPASDTDGKDISSKSKSRKGLSTGAKAGIGVACAIVGLALIGAAIFLFLRKRASSNVPAANVPATDKPENIEGGEFYAPPVLGSQNMPAEITGEKPRAEAIGDRPSGWELSAEAVGDKRSRGWELPA